MDEFNNEKTKTKYAEYIKCTNWAGSCGGTVLLCTRSCSPVDLEACRERGKAVLIVLTQISDTEYPRKY